MRNLESWEVRDGKGKGEVNGGGVGGVSEGDVSEGEASVGGPEQLVSLRSIHLPNLVWQGKVLTCCLQRSGMCSVMRVDTEYSGNREQSAE